MFEDKFNKDLFVEKFFIEDVVNHLSDKKTISFLRIKEFASDNYYNMITKNQIIELNRYALKKTEEILKTDFKKVKRGYVKIIS